MGYLALLLSLCALVVLSYRRLSPLIVGPAVSLLLAVLSGLSPSPTLLGVYMETAGSYFIRFFLVFLTGAVFGSIMHRTGAAASIAEKIVLVLGVKRVILGTVLAAAVLTYGGVSLFVIIFVMYPLSLPMFERAGLSQKMIPGAVALGAFTFTMTTPGSPQIQNIIPISYLGTGPMAGALPGWITGLIIAIVGLLFLHWRAVQRVRRGETFDVDIGGEDWAGDLPGIWTSLAPCVLIVVLLNVFEIDIIWSMTAGILISVFLLWAQMEGASRWLEAVNAGAANSALVLLNTVAIVGYAGVVRIIPQFPDIIETIRGISISPYYFPAVTTTLLAGMAGSASGGLSVAYEALKASFLDLGISAEAIHRISAMAAGTLDSLPHCGAVITLLAVCKVTHADSYNEVFFVTVLIPLLAVFGILVPLSMILS